MQSQCIHLVTEASPELPHHSGLSPMHSVTSRDPTGKAPAGCGPHRTTLSPSSKLTAIRPRALICLKASRGVFLIHPR